MKDELLKQRTMSYLRAYWQELNNVNLQDTLITCLEQYLDVESTRVELNAGYAENRHRKISNNFLFLHIAAWTDGQAASTVPHNVSGENSDLQYHSPAENWDYLDGDGMILIRENHCILMSSGMHPKSMEQYLRNLIIRAKDDGLQFSEEIDRFKLLPISDPSNVEKLLEQGGVKRIKLRSYNYRETFQEMEKNQQQNFKKSLGKDLLKQLMKSLVFSDEKKRSIEQAENVQAELVISLNSRRSGELKPEEFDDFSRAIAEQDDEFEIETKSGERVRYGDLVLTKKVQIKGFANTVSHSHAWEEMVNYFHEISEKGYLEQ